MTKFTVLLFLTGFFLCLVSLNATSQVRNSKKFCVVLDPGHGGRDSVTRAKGYLEKNIVLDIAKQLKITLEAKGYSVIMTRESDVFVPLQDRVTYQADAFISLHLNTVADSIGESVRSMIKGIEIYTGDVNSSTLRDSGARLANCLNNVLSKLDGISVRGVRRKSLAVLNTNSNPSVLIELGFLSNPEDLAFITNPSNYKLLSEQFYQALETFRKGFRKINH